ncbi:centromere binding protein b [Apiospora arundinis]|uniref:CenpB-DNA-bind-domain-containing protein n=1 Tax=Apiospora arundinis TaxID=335852 RepID=A0ABR2JB10_9PEZI
MHNMIGSTGMDQDSLIAHEGTYSNNHWVDVSAYNQMSMPEYNNNFYLAPVTSHGLPSESIGGGHMPPPPVPSQLHQLPIHHQQPLHYSNQQHPQPILQAQKVNWPSLHTNPGQAYSTPPVPIPAQSTVPIRQTPKHLPSITTSQPRKTLSDDDRRRMCQYAADNPKSKQTEIGAKFGVERSTVSKVLRNKDRWLSQEDRSGSPVKRIKGKNVDVERTFVNWVRNQLKKGIPLSDEAMLTKARTFHATTGSSENPAKIITQSWLDKTKRRHNIGPGSMIRRASETAIPDNTRLSRDSPTLSIPHTSGGVSPDSPTDQSSPTASANEENDTPSNFTDFEPNGYKYPHSQSTTSLSSAVTDPSSSAFSGSAFSPASQFTFSPNTDSGLFDQARPSPGSSHLQRPRSQTLGNLDLDFDPVQSSEPPTPRYSLSATAPPSAVESPAHEIAAPTFGMDSAISPKTLHRSRSNSSLGMRSTGGIMSSPTSPSQDDARRAAGTLLHWMQNTQAGFVNNDDLYLVMRLTEKLGLQQQIPGSKGTPSSTPLGGLSRIPEGDNEVTPGPIRLTDDIKHETTMTG